MLIGPGSMVASGPTLVWSSREAPIEKATPTKPPMRTIATNSEVSERMSVARDAPNASLTAVSWRLSRVK